MLNPTTKPLNVALLSISAHNRAILEFFFAGAGRQLFTTTDLPQADALIVDFDHPGAEQEWAEFTRTQPRPAIILSIREISAPNTVWVPKPLTSQSLTNAAARIRALLPRNAAPPAPTREEAVSPPLTAAPPGTPFGLGEHRRRTVPRTRQPQPLVSRSEEAPDAPITPRPPAPPKTTDTAPSPSARLEEAGLSPPAPAEKPAPARDSGPSPEEAQRWQQLCGTEEGQISIRTWHESARLFTPENYLLNTILEALKLARQSRQHTQIRLPHNDFILLMPDVSLVYLTLDLYSEPFTRLCESPIQKGDARLHLPSTQEMAQLAEQVRSDARHTHDLEALVWTSSLITSHGRLNRNTDAGKPLYLRAWPNLTRLEQFPHVLRIAAIWSQKPGNVFDVAQWLDIPQRYVFAFHTAANALGLFVADQDKIQQRREKPVEQKNRGLFSRLLRRLLGGGRK